MTIFLGSALVECYNIISYYNYWLLCIQQGVPAALSSPGVSMSCDYLCQKNVTLFLVYLYVIFDSNEQFVIILGNFITLL